MASAGLIVPIRLPATRAIGIVPSSLPVGGVSPRACRTTLPKVAWANIRFTSTRLCEQLLFRMHESVASGLQPKTSLCKDDPSTA